MGRPKGSFKQPSYREYKRPCRPSLAVVDIDGHRHYLGAFGTREACPDSWREYDRLIGEWYLRGRQGVAAANPLTITVDQMIAAYWQHVQEYYKDKQQHIQVAAMKWLRRYGDTPAASFGPLALKALRGDMVKTQCVNFGKPIGRTLSRRYINNIVNRIQMAFRWATSTELVPLSVYHGLMSVEPLARGFTTAPDYPAVKPVDSADIEAVIKIAPRRIAAMIRLQLLTAARPGEICSMRTVDIDRSGEVWRYVPRSHKTQRLGMHRVIFIGRQAQQILEPFLKLDLHAPIFTPGDADMERRQKSRGDYGGWRRQFAALDRPSKQVRHSQYVPTTYSTMIALLCKRADANAHKEHPEIDPAKPIVKRWHPHQLRHNAATAIREQFGLEVARAVCGHSTMKMTEVYAEQDMEKAARAMLEVG